MIWYREAMNSSNKNYTQMGMKVTSFFVSDLFSEQNQHHKQQVNGLVRVNIPLFKSKGQVVQKRCKAQVHSKQLKRRVLFGVKQIVQCCISYRNSLTCTQSLIVNVCQYLQVLLCHGVLMLVGYLPKNVSSVLLQLSRAY